MFGQVAETGAKYSLRTSAASGRTSSEGAESESASALFSRVLGSFSSTDVPYNQTECYSLNSCGKCLDVTSCVWCSKKAECVNQEMVDSICSKNEQTETCPENMYTIIFIAAVLFLLCVCCILCYFKKFRKMNNYVNSLIPTRSLTVPRSDRETIFKLREGEVEWMCIICGFDNHPRSDACDMCGTDHQFSLDYKSGKKSENEKKEGKKRDKMTHRDILLSAETTTNNQFMDTELPIDAMISQEHLVNLTSGNITSPMHSATTNNKEADMGSSKGKDATSSSTLSSSTVTTTIRNLLSPIKRKEAFNYRRLNQLSLRQKSARRRKMWQRVLDQKLGQFKWVRCSVSDIKVGNAPFGYTPGNSFNDADGGGSVVSSGFGNSALLSASDIQTEQRSGSFSVIPGITEYSSIHGGTHKSRRKSGSSQKSFGGGSERSDSADSFGDAVLLSSSPGFSSVFNTAGTLDWERVESGDVSPRSATKSVPSQGVLSKRLIRTSNDFVAKQQSARQVTLSGANSPNSINSSNNSNNSNNNNSNSNRPDSNLDSLGDRRPSSPNPADIGVNTDPYIAGLHRSSSNPNLSRADRGTFGGAFGERDTTGFFSGRMLSSDRDTALSRSQSMTNTSPFTRRDLIALVDPYSTSFNSINSTNYDNITTPLLSAFSGQPIDAEMRNQAEEYQRKIAAEADTQPSDEDLMLFYYDLEAVAALTFRDKQLWFLDRMTDLQKPRTDGLIRLDIHRSNLLPDSVNTFGTIKADDVHKWLRIQFIGEPGIDAGGLEREWFELATQALLEPSAGLFIRSSGDGLAGSYHINPCSSAINRDHLKYFKFAGLCFGKALMNQQPVAATLSLPLRKQILTTPVTFSDLEFVDANMFQSLVWLKKNKNVESLSLDFSVCYEYFGNRMEYNLKSNGIDIPVTDENKEEYLLLRLRHRLFDSIKEQLESFLAGFYQVIPPDILSVFDYSELDLLLCGVPDIDLEDWRRHTIYLNEYSRLGAKHKVIKWFWKAVEELSREERVRLLQFITGCSRLPAQGFKALQSSDGNFREFNIQSISKKDSQYPRSHTCFNKLDLPLYDSYAELESYLSIVINMDITGFSME